MHGALNFYDDSTHVRIYPAKELSALLNKAGLETLAAGTRRNWYYILGMPLRIAGHWRKGRNCREIYFGTCCALQNLCTGESNNL